MQKCSVDGKEICQRVATLWGKHLESHRMLTSPSSQVKLEEALTVAVEFHNSLQDFINWLTQAEQTLNVASRPSLILDTVLFQIDEHKVSGSPDAQHSPLEHF